MNGRSALADCDVDDPKRTWVAIPTTCPGSPPLPCPSAIVAPLRLLGVGPMKRREFLGVLGGAAAAWPVVARAQQPAMPVVGILATAGACGGRVPQGLERDRPCRRPQCGLRATLDGAIRAGAGACGRADPTSGGCDRRDRRFCGSRRKGGDRHDSDRVRPRRRPHRIGFGHQPQSSRRKHHRFTFFTAQLLQKQVGILHDLLPKATALGVLINPGNPRHQADARDVQAAARTLGLGVHVAEARSEGELDAAFAGLVQRNARALIVAGDTFFLRVAAKIAALAEQHAVAAIFGSRELADAGGLVSYAASLADSSPSRRLCRPHPQGREAWRSAGHAAHQVRACRQPQGRQGDRPRRAAHTARACRRGDRVSGASSSRFLAARRRGRSWCARSRRRSCRPSGFLARARLLLGTKGWWHSHSGSANSAGLKVALSRLTIAGRMDVVTSSTRSRPTSSSVGSMSSSRRELRQFSQLGRQLRSYRLSLRRSQPRWHRLGRQSRATWWQCHRPVPAAI